MKKKKEIKQPILNNESGTFWAYYSPDGYVQVRTIAPTKTLARRHLPLTEICTYKDYEKKGYTIQQVDVSINVVPKKEQLTNIAKTIMLGGICLIACSLENKKNKKKQKKETNEAKQSAHKPKG